MSGIKSKIDWMYRDFVESQSSQQEIAAHDLLTWDRLDLAIKIYYLWNLGRDMMLPLDLYKEHIKCFSLGSYAEPGNPEKNSLDRYIQSFAEIQASIRQEGFDEHRSLIPLSIDGALLNGAHRVSCAIAYGANVKTIKTTLPRESYDWQFFKSRGLPSAYLDIAATAFVDICPDVYIAILWPRSRQFHKNIAESIPRKVYVKDLKLTHRGIHNFLSICYKNEPWLGARSKNYPGVANKLREVYESHGQVRVIAFQSKDPATVIKLKSALRSMLALEKHSLHITDNSCESRELARLLFNANGIHFLNYAKPNRFETLPRKIESIRVAAQRTGIALNDLLVDSSMTLEVYGLRQARDIDVLSSSTQPLEMSGAISSHLAEIIHHQKSLDDLIHNQENYFYYDGVKFLSLMQLRRFKEQRKENKDVMDLKLIERISASTISWRDKFLPAGYFYKAKISATVRLLTISTLKKLGLYAWAKSLLQRRT